MLDRVIFSQALEGNTKGRLKQHRKDSKTGVDLNARVDIGFCLNGLFSLLKQLYQPRYESSNPVHVVVNRCVCRATQGSPHFLYMRPSFLIRVGAPSTSPATSSKSRSREGRSLGGAALDLRADGNDFCCRGLGYAGTPVCSITV